MLKGFRDFLFKGDLISAAVGLVMALATFALTEALVENLITPIIYQELKGASAKTRPCPECTTSISVAAPLPELHRGGDPGRRLSPGKIGCSRAFENGKGQAAGRGRA